MQSTSSLSSARPARLLVLAAAVVAVGACAKSDRPADSLAAGAGVSATAAIATPAAGDSMAGQDMGAMQGMANMTGKPDQDFLRMMSDHHKGLILMAHMTKGRKEGRTAVADATKLDTKQDQELDQMVSMLEKDFKDPYAPKVMPEHQAMADSLKSKTGKEYDRTFYQNVIKHHQEAIKMIDDYLPKAKNTMLKRMAEKMKADQTKEIAEFRQKVSRMGA
ncbi:MAG: DUF305 domain-containing protein [Gemmatimonadota bacterium]|nr:DUF305 domain-containing protein [Gemmatimonadota bacterium]